MYFSRKTLITLGFTFLLSIIHAQEFDIDMHTGTPFSMNYTLPKPFIFSTAAPHYFYTIPTPSNCLEVGESYGEVLTGYENYRPCISRNEDVSSLFHVYLGSSKSIFIEHYEPSARIKSFMSKNISGPSHDYVATKDFIVFAEQYSGLERLALVNHKVLSLEGLERLEHLKYLELSVSYVEDWSFIAMLPTIETLNLACSNISNEDLHHIAKLTTVKTLVLDGTEISDLSGLSEMKNLQNLLLKVTNINELEQLEVLQSLELRWISFDTSLSRQAIRETNPDMEPTLFVTSHMLKMSNGSFIDTEYPAKNCNETNYQPIKVW